MKTYPKINTLWKRDKDNNMVIMPNEFSRPEFLNIMKWHVTEKIHGTNIRIYFNPGAPSGSQVNIMGRTNKAQIPKFLYEWLEAKFPEHWLNEIFPKGDEIYLYGEGYGNRIQKEGKRYRDDVSFILFDAFINGWWIQPEGVQKIAEQLGIFHVPEIIGATTIPDIIDFVKSEPTSAIATDSTLPIEGIVARSNPLMLFREGHPVMFKLKIKDYQDLKRMKGNG